MRALVCGLEFEFGGVGFYLIATSLCSGNFFSLMEFGLAYDSSVCVCVYLCVCLFYGIEPYSVELSPTGVILVLDCENSNLYKISTPLSQCMLISHLKILSALFCYQSEMCNVKYSS